MDVKIISNDLNLVSSSTNGFNRGSKVWNNDFTIKLNSWIKDYKGKKIVLPISKPLDKNEKLGSFKENYKGKSKDFNKTIWCYLTNLLEKNGYKDITNIINFGLDNTNIPSISLSLIDNSIKEVVNTEIVNTENTEN